MEDISNKTLAFLVGIAIVISVVGILSVGKPGIVYITGRASNGNGNVSVNLTSTLSILVTGNINFGNGRVYANSTNATLDSTTSTATGGTWSWSNPMYIYVQNDGTVNESVNVSATANAQQLIGGSSQLFQIKGIATTSGCVTSLQTSYTNVPNSTDTPLQLCQRLIYTNGNNNVNVSALLVIPSDAAVGQRNTTLTFQAYCIDVGC